jgi:hypothetical protein
MTPNIPRVFQVTKHIPGKASENFYCPTVGGKTSTVAGQTSAGHKQEGTGHEEEDVKMCDYTVECGLRLGRARKGYVKEYQQIILLFVFRDVLKFRIRRLPTSPPLFFLN